LFPKHRRTKIGLRPTLVKQKILEFFNISSLYYTTTKDEIAWVIQVISRQRCQIFATATLVWGQPKLKIGLYITPGEVLYELVERSPLILWDDPVPDANSFNYIFTKNKFTWRKANNHCREIGGFLFSFDSYEQWLILMSNVKMAFWDAHNVFWLSSLFFLGIPKRKMVCKPFVIKCNALEKERQGSIKQSYRVKPSYRITSSPWSSN
jgi:hypothetical protein